MGSVLCACRLLHVVARSRCQQLLDRVVARVGTERSRGPTCEALVELGSSRRDRRRSGGRQQVIERQLILTEVARFPPAEPTAAEVDEQVAAMKARAGDRLE